jgi:hypothetical protein
MVRETAAGPTQPAQRLQRDPVRPTHSIRARRDKYMYRQLARHNSRIELCCSLFFVKTPSN